MIVNKIKVLHYFYNNPLHSQNIMEGLKVFLHLGSPSEETEQNTSKLFKLMLLNTKCNHVFPEMVVEISRRKSQK